MRRSRRAQGATRNWYPQIGVNLNGAEFGTGAQFPGTFNTTYTYPTIAELNYYKSKYLKLVRLPFRWENMQPTLSAALDPAELSRMDAFVAAAYARGIQCIPCQMGYGGYGNAQHPPNKIGGGVVTRAQFVDFWTRMATHYVGNPGIYGYGLCNEPVGMPFGEWPAASQAVINGIRTVDTKTAIICPGDNSSTCKNWTLAPSNSGGIAMGGNSTYLLSDPLGNNNLIYETHNYFDSDGSGSYVLTYAQEISGGMSTTVGADRVNGFIGWCQSHGVRGYVGEFGIPNTDSTWIPVLDGFLAAMVKGGCIGTIWGGGPWWGDAYNIAIEPTPETNVVVPLGALTDRPAMATLLKYSNITGQAPP